MADRGVSLKSNQWSCSELSRGAEVCADMAGLTLTLDPQKLSKEQLLQAIQDLAAKILHSIAMAFTVPAKIYFPLNPLVTRRRRTFCKLRELNLSW